MIDVYDIVLNFKKKAYEFYEWNKTDEITHIKKIPSFKVDSKTLFDILNHDVIIKDDFLKQIYNKTELFNKRNIKYAAILFNEETALGVVIDENGFVIKKSKLLFDEEDDIIMHYGNIDVCKLNYTIYKKEKINSNYTRYENMMINVLDNYLNKLYEKKLYDEMKYIYIECFNTKEDNVNKIYMNLKSKINNFDINVINKLKDLFKVIKK
ncbi:MAG: hypothetical protein IJ094_09790 [Bacilli bacterium]|nr:hypothetical protein [Bacilli bacterium]